MIVVDVNVIAYLFIVGDKTDEARQLAVTDREWRIPFLWRHEFLNVVATYIRHGGISVDEGKALYRRANQYLAASEMSVDMERALELATAHGCSAYDAQYAALAEALRVHLVTEDKKLTTQFPAMARTMKTHILTNPMEVLYEDE